MFMMYLMRLSSALLPLEIEFLCSVNLKFMISNTRTQACVFAYAPQLIQIYVTKTNYCELLAACACVCKGGTLCTRATRVSQLFPLTSAELHAHRDPLFSLSVILSYHLPSDLHENIYNVPWNDLPLSNDEPTDAISKTLFRVAEWYGK